MDISTKLSDMFTLAYYAGEAFGQALNKEDRKLKRRCLERMAKKTQDGIDARDEIFNYVKTLEKRLEEANAKG